METSQNQWCHWQKDGGCALPSVPSGSDLTLYLLILSFKHFQVWLAQVSSRSTCLLWVYTSLLFSDICIFTKIKDHMTRGVVASVWAQAWSMRTSSKPDRAVLYWAGQHGIKRVTGLRPERCVFSYCVAFNLKRCVFFLSLRFVEPVECFFFFL